MRPDEVALVQPARAQPQAEAVVHEHLHAVGAPVGKEIGVVVDVNYLDRRIDSSEMLLVLTRCLT